MSNVSMSRRRFAHLLGIGAALAATRPQLPLFAAVPVENTAPDVVRLSSNENPYGPSEAALQAMTESFGEVNRYPGALNDELTDALAKQDGVSAEQILLG